MCIFDLVDDRDDDSESVSADVDACAGDIGDDIVDCECVFGMMRESLL